MAMTVVRKIIRRAKTESGYDFILSDASVDRYGDIIETEGWQLANFKKNPIALFGHDPLFPVGKWRNIKVNDNALRGSLEIAPLGTSDRIDEIRKLVDANILCSVSVGFSPLEYEPRTGDEFGYVYTKQELIECSLVSIPANSNALLQVKSLGISRETQNLIFSKAKPAKKVHTKAERAAIFARAREILARPQTHGFVTRAEALGINDAARALLDRRGAPPLYTEHEMLQIHERALAILARPFNRVGR
jgi:HK97 family phage prohead protease